MTCNRVKDMEVMRRRPDAREIGVVDNISYPHLNYHDRPCVVCRGRRGKYLDGMAYGVCPSCHTYMEIDALIEERLKENWRRKPCQ